MRFTAAPKGKIAMTGKIRQWHLANIIQLNCSCGSAACYTDVYKAPDGRKARYVVVEHNFGCSASNVYEWRGDQSLITELKQQFSVLAASAENDPGGGG